MNDPLKQFAVEQTKQILSRILNLRQDSVPARNAAREEQLARFVNRERGMGRNVRREDLWQVHHIQRLAASIAVPMTSRAFFRVRGLRGNAYCQSSISRLRDIET